MKYSQLQSAQAENGMKGAFGDFENGGANAFGAKGVALGMKCKLINITGLRITDSGGATGRDITMSRDKPRLQNRLSLHARHFVRKSQCIAGHTQKRHRLTMSPLRRYACGLAEACAAPSGPASITMCSIAPPVRIRTGGGDKWSRSSTWPRCVGAAEPENGR